MMPQNNGRLHRAIARSTVTKPPVAPPQQIDLQALNGKVVILFAKPCNAVGLCPSHAEQLGKALLACAAQLRAQSQVQPDINGNFGG